MWCIIFSCLFASATKFRFNMKQTALEVFSCGSCQRLTSYAFALENRKTAETTFLLPTFTDLYRLVPTLPETLRGFPVWCRQCSFEHASQGQTATWRWLRSRASWFARGGLWWPVARFGRCNVVGMNFSSATFTDHRYMMFIDVYKFSICLCQRGGKPRQ